MRQDAQTIWDAMSTASRQHNEHNDCTVRALTAASGLPYAEVHAAFKAAGRKNRRGCNFPSVGAKAAGRLGLKLRRLSWDEYTAKTMITAERDRKLATGNFVVRVRGHVAALVDGKVIDWSQGRRHRIKDIFEVLPAAKPVAKADPKRMTLPAGSEKWRSYTKYRKADNYDLFD